jgi:hypothetical protein
MLGELTLEEAAKEAAGNWHDFECFAWFRENELEDPDDWAIIYHSHRDSGLLDQSNAAAIEKEMEEFTEGDDPDVVMESHHHWAVGHIDGFSVRVYRDGQITEAFKAYHKLAERLANYPILDEEDYSERELEATFENLPNAAWRVKDDYELPDDWESEVYRWFSDPNCAAIENTDDQGGYPSEEELRAAFEALGYEEVANV